LELALVAVEKTAYSFDRLFAYSVPPGLALGAGVRVLVPFGKGKRAPRVGVVFALTDTLPADIDEDQLKDIAQLLDDKPLIPPDCLATAEYLREHCFCTYYEAVRCQLPVGLIHRVRRSFVAAPHEEEELPPLSADEEQILSYLRGRGVYVREDLLKKNLGLGAESPAINSLLLKGLVLESAEAQRMVGEAFERTVRAVPREDEKETPKLTAKQREIMELLTDFGAIGLRELCALTGYTPAVVLALEKKGLAELYDSSYYRLPPVSQISAAPKAQVLTPEQAALLRSLWGHIESGKAHTALLHGVTGSGKTQVYLALAEKTLAAGRGVMLLVPEIALTPQLLSQVRERFGDEAALFHSALAAGERADAWRRVLDGKARVVVGTRSAVFAPLENIGLIVLDEEQEDSYKSSCAPRFDARELAKFRARRHGALVLLASATPSVESYAAALEGKYSLHSLPQRYGKATLPAVDIVDMGAENYGRAPELLSLRLKECLSEVLEKGEQAVLLLNRRGYNTFAVCRSCKTVLHCPQCSISLTYHAAENRLLCHYCGYSRGFSSKCPECRADGVSYYGFGTQRAQEQLAAAFPQARVLRMDSDSVAQRGGHARLLESFGRGEYDILLGTQMVAKGLDFENVTLVGVLSVDSQLHDDDYRCLERSFSLLTQVVGRAGRGQKSGRAILQTLSPEEETLSLAAAQDYPAFFRSELAIRRALVYPPFCALYALGFACQSRGVAESAARFALDYIRQNAGEDKLIVLGPMPSRPEKVGGKFRFRLIIKTHGGKKSRTLLSSLLKTLGSSGEYSAVSVSIGRNPADL
jgi:primosomal protein N' (replication factor Y)